MLPSMLLYLAVDTVTYFQPAVTGNPYLVEGFYNPPWILIFLLPLRWMSPEIASLFMRLLGVAAATYISWKLSKNPISVLAFSLSAPILFDVWLGNINSLVMLGMFLPAPLALIVLSIKPQLTIGLMAFIIWRNRHQLLKTVGPLVLIFLLSLILYGWWPSVMLNNDLGDASWNWSLWPWGIGIGALMFLLSNTRLGALAASPFFSPYVSGAGWCGLFLYLATKMPFIVLVIDLVLILRFL